MFSLLTDTISPEERQALVAKVEALGMRCYNVEVGGRGLSYEEK